VANRKKKQVQRAKATSRGARAARRREDHDLMRDIRRAMTSRSPLDLLMLVSTLMAALDSRRRDPWQRDDGDALSLSDLVTTMLGVDEPETTAVLSVLAVLSDDELTRSRIRRELATRHHRMPDWLDGFDATRHYRAVKVSHALDDGENVVIGSRLPSGQELTTVCYIDFNLGTVVKDAFVVDEPLAGTLARLRAAAGDDPDTEMVDIDLAAAQARLASAIKLGAMTYPPLESDTWPACRPFVEWIVRRLPDGGEGYRRSEYSDRQLDDIAGQFLASQPGAGFASDSDHRYLLDWLLWYASAYGPCDPLHWSPTSVEIVLLDAIPRKIVAKTEVLAKAPAVLRGLIRYSHQQRGIRTSLTDATLAAVDDFEPEYQQLIRSQRPQGPMALLAAMGSLDPSELTDIDDPDTALAALSQIMLGSLRDAVGGEAALQALDAAPLPDEPFDWNGIPEDIRTTLAQVLQLIDRCCDELLDVEYRTACRRLLARVANGDPRVFRRTARADTAAAAVCWIIGKANDRFTTHAGGLRAKTLLAHFGVSGSVSQRAGTLLQAGGFTHRYLGQITLGAPDYLVSARRAAILETRQRFITGTAEWPPV
jgi:Domain of unknown function (DUF6398)